MQRVGSLSITASDNLCPAISLKNKRLTGSSAFEAVLNAY